MSFYRTVLILLIFFPIYIYSQVEEKKIKPSAEKLAYDKALELIYESANEAYDYGNQSIEKIGVPKDSINYSGLLNVTGEAAFRTGKYSEALRIHQESAVITEKLNLIKSHAGCLSNIANVFYYIDQYDNAIYYVKLSLYYYSKIDSVEDKVAARYNTLGVIYNEINKKDSAIFYYEKALEIMTEENTGLSVLLSNLGAISEEQKDFDKALDYYLKSIRIKDNYDDLDGLSWTMNHIGRVYTEQGRYKEAKKALSEGLIYAKQIGQLINQKDINESFFHLYLATSQLDSASYYFREYQIFNDSINGERLNKNIQEMEAKYQVEKKEAALALSNEKAARLTTENKANKLYLTGAAALLALLAGGFFVANRNYQQKRKIASIELELKNTELKEMMSQQEAASLSAMLRGQEEERERVAKDLHDRLGGTLAALKMGMRRAENKVEKEELDMLDEAVVEVRNIAHNLSSGVMERAGLRVALLELKKMIERSGEIKFDVFVQDNLSEIGQESALELYRIVQELTNNTIKHAKATSISVQATMANTNFNLIYEDNGKGFVQTDINEGMGMRNMRARAEKINGSFHLDSSPGRGTIAIIEIERTT